MLKIKEITSSNNCQIKLLRKLAQKKHRRQMGKFAVENLAIIIDALSGGIDFLECFITPQMLQRHEDKLLWLQEHSKVAEFHLIDEDLNKSYSQLDTPSGITALYEIKQLPLDGDAPTLYLNGIKDPGNIGTMLRSALAFDVSNIVLDAACVDIYNFKAINAAKDAIFKLNIFIDESGQWLKEQKGQVPIYVANSHEGIELGAVEVKSKFCLVCGSESHGVSEDIIKMADKNIHIDISNKIESLNVSTATAILLHGLRKKL
ncbi:TrmH family RNA methyltransferase [Candidatus Omnitrophota bacterium]